MQSQENLESYIFLIIIDDKLNLYHFLKPKYQMRHRFLEKKLYILKKRVINKNKKLKKFLNI